MAEVPIHLPDGVKRELQEAAMGGFTKLKDLIKNRNGDWKTIPLNIALTGESGVGKSSFINAIRGVKADDVDGAHVDVVEGTKKIESYKHPSNEMLTFWDLPGVGTPNFPRETYLKKVNFKQYDFFLIMSAGRFRDNDLWLAKEIRSLNRNFYFVRTQIDIDIEKDRKANNPNTHEKSKVIEKVRMDCKSNLERHGLNSTVFIIDNYVPLDFDFNDLATTLIDELPENKKEAMTLSMSLLTSGILKKKIEVLSQRILKVSILSAVGGAIPIPLVGALVDGGIVADEVLFFKQQLGLDEQTMAENTHILKEEARELEERLCLRSLSLAGTAKGLVQGASGIIYEKSIENELPFAIPFISSVVSAGVSYGTTVAVLKYYLKLCSEDAFKINEELMRNAMK